MEKRELPGIQLFRLIYNYRKRLLMVFLISAILSTGYSLIVPHTFRATTTILPPIEEEGLSSIASLMSDLPLQALGLGSASSGAELFIAILQSRTVMTTIAEEYRLMKRYKKKNMELTLRELLKHVGVLLNEEGTISLFVDVGGPWFGGHGKKEEARILARDMANSFIKELDELNRQLRSERGKNTRQFIEKRYHQNLRELTEAEENLKTFQENHGIIYLPEQTRVTIEAASEIKAQLIAKEIEIGVLRQTVGKNHSELLKAQREYNMLQEKYQEFQSLDVSDANNMNDIFLTFQEMPKLGLDYLRLYREVMLQEKILEFVIPQYEQAKIQEAKDTPSLQVLDPAIKPIRKYRPKRAFIVLFYTFFSMLVTLGYYYFKPLFSQFYSEIRFKNE